jgi:hypothetical protein
MRATLFYVAKRRANSAIIKDRSALSGPVGSNTRATRKRENPVFRRISAIFDSLLSCRSLRGPTKSRRPAVRFFF